MFLSNDSRLSIAKNIKLRLNKVIKVVVPLSLIMLGLVLYLAKLREMFNFSFLHVDDLILCLVCGIGAVTLIEFIPMLRKRNE